MLLRKNIYYDKDLLTILYLNLFSFLRGWLHEISFRAKGNIVNSLSGQSLITVYMISLKRTVLFHSGHFWQKWNLMSGFKCYANTTSKWNHPKRNIVCEYFIKTKTVDQKITTKLSFILFRPQWKLM